MGSEWLLKLLTLDTESGQLSVKANWSSDGFKVKGIKCECLFYFSLAMIPYCSALGKSRKVLCTTPYYKLTLLALLLNQFGNFSLINPQMAEVMA